MPEFLWKKKEIEGCGEDRNSTRRTTAKIPGPKGTCRDEYSNQGPCMEKT